MLGASFLNDILSKARFDSSKMILERMHVKIQKALKHKDVMTNPNEGMDMSICKIDIETRKFQYSGANIDMIRVCNGVVRKVIADSHTVGSADLNATYGMVEDTLIKGEEVYLMTDGFVNQNGRDFKACYGRKKMDDFLINSNRKNFEKREGAFLDEFLHWKKDNKQTDDVLIFGMKC